MANPAVQLSAVAPTLLPPIVTGPIFEKAYETSAVMQLAQRVPLSVNAQTAIPITMDVPTAGWVNEGQAKPVGSTGVGVKVMQGKKVALLVPFSEEVVRTNPAGIYTQLQNMLPTAIGRAFDYAAIHGKDLRSGGAGPFAEYLAMTPNAQVLGTTAQDQGGTYADLVKGVQQVVATPGYEFTGFAADPRLKPELMLSTDTLGRPLWADTVQGAANTANLIGYRAAYNPGVSGRYYRQGDAVQVVTLNGTPTGGTFTLSVAGEVTAPIAYNAAASTVQAAIQALGTGSVFGGNTAAANATVSGSVGGPYTVTFGGVAAPMQGRSQLTGGTNASVTVAPSTSADTGLRAIGGDWSQCAYGVGMDISVRISQEASYTPDGGTTWISSFQSNQVLLLVEAYFGFVVGDPNAFVAYTTA